MQFSKIAVLALAGVVAANADNQQRSDNDIVQAVHAIAEAPAPTKMARAEPRDVDDIINSAKGAVNDASTWVEGVKSQAESIASDVASHVSTAIDGAKTKYSDVASHVSTAIGGAETYISTKINAASSAVDSAKSAASSAAASASSAANQGNAAPSSRDAKSGLIAAGLALGATAFGFFLI